MLEPVSAKGPWAGQVGMMVESAGKVWRLVRLDYDGGTVDSIDGGLAYYSDESAFEVTFDASAAEGLAAGLAGGVHQVIDVSALTEDQFMWVQVGGPQLAVVIAASAVASDVATGHASTDNVATRTAGGTAAPDSPHGTVLSTRGTTTSDEGASVANSSTVRWNLGTFL
jgi:hypothetical protein